MKNGGIIFVLFAWLITFVVSLGVPIGLLYLVWHFAKKYW